MGRYRVGLVCDAYGRYGVGMGVGKGKSGTPLDFRDLLGKDKQHVILSIFKINGSQAKMSRAMGILLISRF